METDHRAQCDRQTVATNRREALKLHDQVRVTVNGDEAGKSGTVVGCDSDGWLIVRMHYDGDRVAFFETELEAVNAAETEAKP